MPGEVTPGICCKWMEMTPLGWEYHNRKRTERGTWADQSKHYRISVRLSNIQLQLIRGRAYARSMSMSEYIMSLIDADLMPGRSSQDTPTPGSCTPTVSYPQLSRGRNGLAQPLTAGTQYN